MERLTKRLEDGQVAMDCTNCPEDWADKPNSDCTALYCRNRLKDRISAIEDILGDDYDLDRLRELVEADREGRCVVLPCKVGDYVYLTNWFGKTKHEIYRVIDPYFYTDDARGFSLKEFGKTVFLTREAAEAALKGEQDG